jgi:hypothetical protein
MRGAWTGRQAPGPFHCLACQTYVTGTPSGHCPRCGFVPPVAPPPAAEPRSLRPLVLLIAILIALVVVRLA